MENPYSVLKPYEFKYYLKHLIGDQQQKRKDLEETITDLEYIEAVCMKKKTIDFLNDCKKIKDKSVQHSISHIPNTLSRINRYISERPELVTQFLYNHLIWYESPNSQVKASIESAHHLLMRREYWIKAEGPLPGSKFSLSFETHSPIQALSANCEQLAIASPQGNIEIRHVPDGELKKNMN